VAFGALTVHEDDFAGNLAEDGAVPAFLQMAQHTFAGQVKHDLGIDVAARQDFRHEGCVQLASTELRSAARRAEKQKPLISSTKSGA
jgi:hypothetical protein